MHFIAKQRPRWMSGAAAGGILLLSILGATAAIFAQDAPEGTEAVVAFDRAPASSPITMDYNKNLVWVVNPDDDKVTVLGNLDGTPSVLKQINVGDEPQSIAVDTDGSPDSYHVYVANAAGNSVSIITVNSSSASSVQTDPAIKTIVTGSEPWNVVVSPDGKRAFVANSGQDTITVIRTDTQTVIGAIDVKNSLCNGSTAAERALHFQPRGLAVTLDNSKLYVTRFLSFTGGASPKQGTDDGHVGVVCQITIDTNSTNISSYLPAKRIELGAQITGFKFPNNANDTRAWPNQMQSIVIRGDQAYLPNIAASPSGPLRFNVDTQSYVNVLDGVTGANPSDASATKFVNMHLAARLPETGKKKLFFANPWAIDFTNNSGAGAAYAVSSGSDILVKLNVDASGALSFTGGVSTTTYIDLNNPSDPATQGAKAGKNPLGIVIRNGSKAFVMNYISRNVSVVDLTANAVVQVIQTSALPFQGTQDEQLHVGKELFFSSRGHFDRPANTTVSTEDRLSSEGWQNCASCHFAGLTDGVVWTFVTGPRKSVPMNATWSPHNADDQRMLNYSAIFEEVQDFEINARNVSGPGNLTAQGKPAEPCAFLPAPAAPNTVGTGIQDSNHGLIIGDDGDINKAPCVVNAFAKPNGGRKQLTVTLPGSSTAWPALDSIKEWVRFSIRTPNGLLTTDELTAGGGVATGGLSQNDVNGGRRLFFQAGCQKCHGGTKWTTSNKDFVPPPTATDISTEVVTTTVADQYINRFLVDIKSFNLGVSGANNAIPGQAEIGAIEKAANGLNALGRDDNNDGKGTGYNIPALLGIWHVPPYYHNGACESLDCVLDNADHRKSGNSADPIGSDEAKQAKVVAFLQALDQDTPFPNDLAVRSHNIFFDPPTVLQNTPATVGVNVDLFGTKADLNDLLTDLGQNVKVRFAANGVTFNPAEVSVPASAFAQNFGQAVVTTTFTAANTGIFRITVSVDPEGVIPENNENNNVASRRVRVVGVPTDSTSPRISSVAISDDATFNDADPIAQSGNVKIKFVAEDPANPPAPTSGLDQFCIVTYTYDSVNRIWVERECEFKPLPAPTSANTFIVEDTLDPKAGAIYAFVWVKDVAGNISRRPGFDIITFVPSGDIELNRNRRVILRLPLAAGQNLKVTVTPDIGDVDVSVFDDFTNPNATRVALSANNGLVAEEVNLVGPGRFQVEIRAIVNSRFKIAIAQTEVGAAAVTSGLTPLGADNTETPFIAGPPAAQTAIGEPTEEEALNSVFLPIVTK